MESKKQEALRARDAAEKRFIEKDFVGARHYALKAQGLYPGLEGIAQMVSTFEIYVASEAKYNGEIDYYSVLRLNPSADHEKVKKQYRKMAVLLHPDKNKTVGADGAFKLISEAWTLLSDGVKRHSYDQSRIPQTNLSFTTHAGSNSSVPSSSSHHRLDTFWTVCTSCKVQYEYLRKYLNKKLSCKNCRGVFMAVETGAAPINATYPYHAGSYPPNNGYANHVPNTVAYIPTMINGVSGYHPGHGSEYVSNVSFQWKPDSGTVNPNGLVTNGKVKKRAEKVKYRQSNLMKRAMVNAASNAAMASNEALGSKINRPDKKMKVDTNEMGTESNGVANGVQKNQFFSSPIEQLTRRSSSAPGFDARKLLIEKARTEIRKKLVELKLTAKTEATAAAETKAEDHFEIGKSTTVAIEKVDPGKPSNHSSEKIKSTTVSITVPDPDFHDFDKDRLEECFKPKQIWAIYDEEDGMPRLYCIIREVISVSPFKIYLTYLSSRTDKEFGSVNWINSGFTKSCGNFKAMHSDTVEQVNIFSHVITDAKAGRGGCVRIYPKRGEIWAIYKNWTEDWNFTTPDEVRHKYEMVEVLDDYSEDLGVCVNPLTKLDGYKTVYQKNEDKNVIRWVPRREMLRFSHQVPSCLLKGEAASNLPEGCWDLDPAATPNELLLLHLSEESLKDEEENKEQVLKEDEC